MNYLSRWLAVVLIIFAPSVVGTAESVNTLPAPTGYVNDFASVLSPSTKSSLENLCTQVDRQAHAQIAVVTVKSLDGDQPIEEFATALEDKWKVGAKGTDRGVLMIFVMTPRRGRIEVGYGLEGILNDAKVGDIGRSMVPAAQQGDYNTAIPLGVTQIAGIIATDAGVTLNLAQPVHQYHRQQQPVQISLTQVIIGGGAILLILFFLVKTGNTGLIFFLLGNLMGGGGGGFGGGRGRDDDRGGGGFGGFGGGSSGGGGASGDF
ncbi:TPM domain-containing protein [Tunturiibacter gelidiferens]|uniref:TPM domain-containing protein n=1 Tax=Tunturiibacter gelidiferens TaxID=3069689 RepID=UPI003D9B2F01